jgi:hypothetical protein
VAHANAALTPRQRLRLARAVVETPGPSPMPRRCSRSPIRRQSAGRCATSRPGRPAWSTVAPGRTAARAARLGRWSGGSCTCAGGTVEFGAPKTHQQRTVPIPGVLVEPLSRRCQGKGPDDLVLTSPGGAVLRSGNFWRRFFDPAAKSAGLEDHRLDSGGI